MATSIASRAGSGEVRSRRSRLLTTRKGGRVVTSGAILIAALAVGLVGPALIPYDPLAMRLEERIQPPGSRLANGWVAWFGTDQLGRDLLQQVVHGARVSILVALSTVVIAGCLGTIMGLIAGYAGGATDMIIMRLVDLQLAFPPLLLAILISAVLGPSVLNVILTLSVIRWAVFARLVHGSVLSLREKEFVEAARSLGAPTFRQVTLHILPNALGPVIVAGSLDVAAAIIAESSLSFLGLGFPPDIPTWGRILFDAKDNLDFAPHWAIFPGTAIFLTVLSINYIGDGLRDALDPRKVLGGK